MIIVDLDDTIFQTSSMNPKIFDSAIEVVAKFYAADNADEIVKEIWTIPIDQVFSKYNTPRSVVDEFYLEIGKVNYQDLKLYPFEDYYVLREIQEEKILVTTGLKELQNAKIDALEIRNDFTEIFIDDPRHTPRSGKLDIFKSIIENHSKAVHEIWVIGDNPHSEIEAAYQLGIKTIQRSSPSKVRSNKADFYIETFHELEEIMLSS